MGIRIELITNSKLKTQNKIFERLLLKLKEKYTEIQTKHRATAGYRRLCKPKRNAEFEVRDIISERCTRGGFLR